jgi:hypothetical protein
MARTIAEIQEAMVADIRSREGLEGLTSTSSTALYVLITYVVAAAIAAGENIQDLARRQLREDLARLKPHSLRWYKEIALAYRKGVAIDDATASYPEPTDSDNLVIQRVVLHASVRAAGSVLQIRVAKKYIDPLSVPELNAFRSYLEEVKDAGVELEVSSRPADRLRATLDVYYDPQVLDGAGRRLDGTKDIVVASAVIDYTENLAIDGRFTRTGLVDRLQQAEGVQLITIRTLEIAPDGEAYVGASEIYEPASGFVRLYSRSDLTVNYIPLSNG